MIWTVELATFLDDAPWPATRDELLEYADRIGAEYRFDHNITIAGKVVNVPIYYEPANPLVDKSFDKYDNVALIDIDVFPVEDLSENIFDQLNGEDAGICTEPSQPFFRQVYNVAGITNANDTRWANLLKEVWGIEYSYGNENQIAKQSVGFAYRQWWNLTADTIADYKGLDILSIDTDKIGKLLLGKVTGL